MHAVLVNPENQSVENIETDASLISLQIIVGGYIEYVPIEVLNPVFTGIHMYLNEEGRLIPEIERQRWYLAGWPESYLCGPAILLCSTPMGEEAPCSMSAEQFSKYVTWNFR